MKRLILLSILLIAFTAAVGPEFVLAKGDSTVIRGHLDEIYYITEPGNYIVEGEVGPIFVEASNVHLDLNGGIVHQTKPINVGIAIKIQTKVHISGPGTVMCEGEKTVGIVVHGDNNHVNGVSVKSCDYMGILVQASSGNKIIGNVIEESGSGILVGYDSDGNSIVGNTATKCTTGIYLQGSSKENDFKGNVSNDNLGWGIFIETGSAAPINNRFIGNTALNNGVKDIKDENGNCEANTWRGNTFNTADPGCFK